MTALLFFGCLGVGVFLGGAFAALLVFENYVWRTYGIDLCAVRTPRHVALRRVLSPNNETGH